MTTRTAVIAAALVIAALWAPWAGAVADEAPADSYSQLSPGQKAHVDALYDGQGIVDGKPMLTKDAIVTSRADGGWGKAFKAWREDGYFAEYKSFGALVSAGRGARLRPAAVAGAPAKGGRAAIVVTNASGRQLVFGLKKAAKPRTRPGKRSELAARIGGDASVRGRGGAAVSRRAGISAKTNAFPNGGRIGGGRAGGKAGGKRR